MFNFYTYSIYKFLKASKPAPVPDTDLKKGRNWFMGLSIFGTVIFGLMMIAMILIPLIIGIVAGYQNAKMRVNGQISPDLKEMQVKFEDKTSEKMPAVSTGKVLNNENYVHKLLKFSIKPPQGWLTEEGSTLLDGVIMSDASEGILTKVIQVQYFEGEFISSDEAASTMIKAVLQSSSNVDSQSISSSKIYIGPRLTYRFNGKMFDDRGIQYNFIPHEQGVYIITAGWQNDISAEDKQIIAESISTFRALE